MVSKVFVQVLVHSDEYYQINIGFQVWQDSHEVELLHQFSSFLRGEQVNIHAHELLRFLTKYPNIFFDFRRVSSANYDLCIFMPSPIQPSI